MLHKAQPCVYVLALWSPGKRRTKLEKRGLASEFDQQSRKTFC